MAQQNIRIVEVGPRDGLQNQPKIIPLEDKLEWIRRLKASGLREIELTSFVHPKWIPQLADHNELSEQVKDIGVPLPSALVPNIKGLEGALRHGYKRIALFAASSESFSQKNINCSIAESMERFRAVTAEIEKQDDDYFVRAYLSTCFGCPYEGRVEPAQVAKLSKELLELGADEVAISDTIGVASPKQVHEVVKAVQTVVPTDKIALHFHDTRGTALANVYAALDLGIHIFDSSAGGLGGCPYAPGAAGNLATEDLIYMLDQMGLETGVDLSALVEANLWFEEKSKLQLPSRALASFRTCSDS